MRARKLLGMILLSAALLAGCLPFVETLPTPTGFLSGPDGMQTPQFNETPQPALLEKRLLVLEWPQTIREKDSELIVLTIAMDESGQMTAAAQALGGEPEPIEIPNIYDTHVVLAVARLDLAGMEAYRENIREPLLPGKPVVFRWSIRANEAGVYRGIVWLHLELVPRAGGPVSEQLLLSRPIEIRAVTVLGLPGNTARLIGGIGLVVSTVLGFPFIQGWVASMRKWRSGKPGAKGGTPPAAAEHDE